MEEDAEIGAEEAHELVKKGREIYVFTNSYVDLELVAARLGAENGAKGIDIGEAMQIMLNTVDKGIAESLARKFDGSIIVCPHGRMSLEFASKLSGLGIKAYSLKGGIEGLKSRALKDR
ncbi:MAG: hypothetical protein ACYCO0_02540 [Candidatus Micrarchaeaceae archaeon]